MSNVSLKVELQNVSCYSLEYDKLGRKIGERMIVQDVSFVAFPGQLIGLLGGSGSGKSSLLNLLANRGGALSSSRMRCSGRVTYNGMTSEQYHENNGTNTNINTQLAAASSNNNHLVQIHQPATATANPTVNDRSPLRGASSSSSSLLPGLIVYSSNSLLQRRIGYLLQNDFLLPHLTVRETLLYAARLRLSSTISDSMKVERVDQLITELNLASVRDSLVGDVTHRGISGGERRRVSLGVQVLTDPALLLCDECTTGLDAFTAANIIQCLVQLAHGQGRTVLATLHQPRATIFEMLDLVVLLSHGRVIYQGTPAECTRFFERHGYALPLHVNPADYFIDTISLSRMKGSDAENRLTAQRDLTRIRSLRLAFERERRNTVTRKSETPLIRDLDVPASAIHSLSKSNLIALSSSSSSSSSKTSSIDDTVYASNSSTSLLHQISLLTRRGWVSLLRDRGFMQAYLLEVLFLGGMLGLVFWRMPDDTEGSIRSRIGLTYLASSLHFYLCEIFFLWRFIPDLCVSDYERENHMYGVSASIVSHQLIYLPFYIIFTILYIVIVYLMCAMRYDNDISYPLIWICGAILLQHVATSISLLCASISRSFAESSLILNTFFSIFTLEAGYLVLSSALPVYVKWLQPISFTWYGFRLFVSTEFSERILPCNPVEQPTGSCDLFNGKRILAGLFIDENDYLVPFVGLATLWIGFTLITSFILWRFPKFVGEAAEYVSGAAREFELDEDDNTQAENEVFDAEQQKDIIVHVSPAAAASPAAASLVHEDLPLVPPSNVSHPQSGGRPLVVLRVSHLSLSVRKRRVLSWRNFWQSSTGPLQQILDDVSFTIQPGQLVALMGVSGCGKSSLLDLIARRGTLLAGMKGSIEFNGEVLSHQRWDSVVGYVQQSDHLLPYLTVRDTLTYAAKLRLPSGTTLDQCRIRVNDVISELGLESCADTLIGNESVKGCSGGEQRRVSIGIQMLTDPPVLLLDEPTSGLDSFNSLAVTRTLVSIARRGRTVICSIHQPRADVFQLMDRLILMAPSRSIHAGGHVVFDGPRVNVKSHFTSEPLNLPFPQQLNIADVLLDLCSLDGRTQEKLNESRERVDLMVQVYTERCQMVEADQHASSESSLSPRIPLLSVASIWVAFRVILSRSFLNLRRQRMLLITVVCQTIAFGAILTLFYAPLHYDQLSIQSRLGLIQQLTGLIFIGNLNHLSLFVAQREVFYREYSERAYTTGAFFLAYLTMEIVLELIGSFGVTAIFMFGAGLQHSSSQFFAMWFSIFCLLNGGESFAMSVGSLVSSVGVSLSITNCVFSFTSLIVGIYSLVMPSWIGSATAWNVMKYLIRLVARGEFESLQFYCKPDQMVSVIGPNNRTDICPITTGAQVLQLYQFNEGGYTEDLLIIGGLTIGYRIISYFVLQYAVANQRK